MSNIPLDDKCLYTISMIEDARKDLTIGHGIPRLRDREPTLARFVKAVGEKFTENAGESSAYSAMLEGNHLVTVDIEDLCKLFTASVWAGAAIMESLKNQFEISDLYESYGMEYKEGEESNPDILDGE